MYTVSIYISKQGLKPVNFTFHLEQVAVSVAKTLFVACEVELVEVWFCDQIIYNRLKANNNNVKG